MDVAAELGRNLVTKNQIQPAEYGYDQADTGRDCRTRLARPNSQKAGRVCMVITYIADNGSTGGKVADRGQLNRKHEYFPVPFRV